MHKCALASTQAQLAEAAGDRAAAELYMEAAERWREFGNIPERAYALLGQGRCLAALGEPGAEAPLREAKELLAQWATSPLSRRRRRCSPRPLRPLRRSLQTERRTEAV